MLTSFVFNDWSVQESFLIISRWPYSWYVQVCYFCLFVVHGLVSVFVGGAILKPCTPIVLCDWCGKMYIWGSSKQSHHLRKIRMADGSIHLIGIYLMGIQESARTNNVRKVGLDQTIHLQQTAIRTRDYTSQTTMFLWPLNKWTVKKDTVCFKIVDFLCLFPSTMKMISHHPLHRW